MSRICWLHVILALPLHLVSSITDVFTSTQHMQEVMGTEGLTFQDAHYFILLEESRLDRLIAQHELFTVPASHSSGHVVLEAFLHRSRLTSSISHFIPGTSHSALGALRPAYTSPSSRGWWPTDRDVHGASAGICKLQRAYHIPVSRMAAMQSHLMAAASPGDFSDVARGCFVSGPFGNTSSWSEFALERGFIQGSRSRRHELGVSWLQANEERWPRWQNEWRPSLTLNRPLPYPTAPENDIDTYKSSCVEKGDVRPVAGHLVCKMSTNYGQPELILQPHKIEVLSLEPRIVLFPSFLRALEANYIREAAQKRLERMGTYTKDKPAGEITWKRISKEAWLSDAHHPVLRRVTRRIAAVTGLSLESAEAYLVANYGLGGHYTPHPDAHAFDVVAAPAIKADGNRLATMLLYLSDVQAGGATAFVDLGVAVKASVGAALFWYNVEPYEGIGYPEQYSFWHQKRALDHRTWHVGCPVLWGSKWVSIKWIHERGNVHVRYDTPD